MLAADKQQLQSALKQQATALKEKEFQLHHSNLMTVGTQAAVLAGLDITMFIEFAPAPDSAWAAEYQSTARCLKVIYYGIIVAAFGANMMVVSHTTVLSVLGAGLALRGPDGSMLTATDGLYDERQSVFFVFGIGLACTVGSVLVSVWLLLPAEAAAVCWCVTLYTCRQIYRNYVRVQKRFGFDETETVDFRDFLELPPIRGTIRGSLPPKKNNNKNTNHNSSNGWSGLGRHNNNNNYNKTPTTHTISELDGPASATASASATTAASASAAVSSSLHHHHELSSDSSSDVTRRRRRRRKNGRSPQQQPPQDTLLKVV